MYWLILVIVLILLLFWWNSPEFPVQAHVYKIAFVAMLAYIAGFLDSRHVASKDKTYGAIVNQPEDDSH